MIVCLSGRGDKGIGTSQRPPRTREESKMGKTLTEHLKVERPAARSLFLILWREIMKKAWQVCRNPSNFGRCGVSAIEVGIPFRSVADGLIEAELRIYIRTTTEGLVQTISVWR